MDKTDRDTEYDAVADVRAMRQRDIELTEAKWARVEAAAAGPGDPDAGRRLLLELGLDPDGPAAEPSADSRAGAQTIWAAYAPEAGSHRSPE